MGRPYLLFDAGGTLVFLSAEVFRREAARFGYAIEPGFFYDRLAGFEYRHDEGRRRGVPREEIFGHRHFFRVVLEELGVSPEDAETIKDAIVAIHSKRNIWNATYPWVAETLTRLKRMGYGMSIISNTDARVKEQLEDGGIVDFFDQIFDSKLIGFTKPDPRLFKYSCDALGVQPEECLYIGDSLMIDVLGANNFGMPAVLVDWGGLYGAWGGLRVKTVQELPQLLEQHPDIFHAPGAFVFPPGSMKEEPVAG
ncbi:MAG: HAD family hydrolase [Bacteroidota bacterium]